MHLYETHLPVADTKVAERFYREIVGLPFAYRDPTRDIVFLWADAKEKAMIGLWGRNTVYDRQNGVVQRCHLAFAVTLDELFAMIAKLNQNGIDTLGFGGDKTKDQPSSDGCHQLRFISEILTGTCLNSSPFCRVGQTQVSMGHTQNGKN